MSRLPPLILLLVCSAIAKADEPGGAERAGKRVDEATAAAKLDITDSWITGRIKEQFLVDSLVKGRHIEVETRNHQVTLTGQVQSADALERALSIARNTDGVVGVTDHLDVGAHRR